MALSLVRHPFALDDFALGACVSWLWRFIEDWTAYGWRSPKRQWNRHRRVADSHGGRGTKCRTGVTEQSGTNDGVFHEFSVKCGGRVASGTAWKGSLEKGCQWGTDPRTRDAGIENTNAGRCEEGGGRGRSRSINEGNPDAATNRVTGCVWEGSDKSNEDEPHSSLAAR